MLGVHNSMQRTALRAAADAERYAVTKAEENPLYLAWGFLPIPPKRCISRAKYTPTDYLKRFSSRPFRSCNKTFWFNLNTEKAYRQSR